MKSKRILLITLVSILSLIYCSEGGRNQYHTAYSLQEKGQLEEAIAEYEKLIDESKKGKWVELAKEQIEICHSLILYQESEELLREGNVEEARSILFKANKEHRLEHKALYIEGRLYILEGKIDRAEIIFLDIIERYPALPEGYLGLAIIEELQGKVGSAIHGYGNVLRLTRDVKMKEEAGMGLERLVEGGLDGEMMVLVEEQLSNFQGTPKLLYKMGEYYLYYAEEPDYNRAISYFNRALSAQEIDDQFKLLVYIDMAHAYELGGGTQPAYKYINLGLSIDPENKELLLIKERLQKNI